jgi:hypothetical protein
MTPEILLVRQRDGFRVLHGHLHLASVMNQVNEVIVEVSGEGKFKAIKTNEGILIDDKKRCLPILMNA